MAETNELKPAELLPLRERVSAVLDRIRPFIQQDGGDIELAEIDEASGVVFVRMKGACHGCPSSMMTLQMGIENELKIECPEVKQVIQV